jgi:hypothetical protein
MKFIDKNTVFLSLMTAGLIGLSIGGLTYVMSKTAEQKMYMTINSYIGQKGSFIEGLNLRFEKEDISCFGLVKFDCVIKNAKLNAPKAKLRLFEAEEIQIGTFTKNGIDIRQRKLDFYAKIKNITYAKGNPLLQNMTKEGKVVSKYMYPFNINLEMKVKRYKNGEAKGSIKGEYLSKIFNGDFKTNIKVIQSKKVVQLDKNLHLSSELNATAGARLGGKYNTIITDFESNLENKKIGPFLYSVYEYYYNNAESLEKKKTINYDFIAVDSNEKITEKNFLDEFEKRLTLIIPDADKEILKKYIKGFSHLVKKDGNTLTLKGINRDNFTAEELGVLKRLDMLNKPWEYYKLEIKQGERK